MKTLLRNLAALMRVKNIVTVVVLVIFATLALRGDLASDTVMTVVAGIVAFYFRGENGAKPK